MYGAAFVVNHLDLKNNLVNVHAVSNKGFCINCTPPPAKLAYLLVYVYMNIDTYCYKYEIVES